MKKKSSGRFSNFIKKQSISRNLALSLSLIVFLVLACLLTLIHMKLSHDMLKDVEKKADEHISRISVILSSSMWNIDIKAIRDVGTEFAHGEIVYSICITDINGSILFKFNNPPDNAAKINRKGAIFFRDSVIGHAEISFSLKKQEEELSRLVKLAFLIFAVSAIIIYIGTGFFLRIFLRAPLEELCSGIDQVARGDFSHNFKILRYGEFSGIIERFMKMAHKIEKREKALRESEARFKNLFNLSPQCIFLEEIESGILVDVNMEFCKLARQERHELTGRTTLELGMFSISDREKFIIILKESGEVSGMETEFNLKNSGNVHALMSAKIISIKNRELVLNVFLDITERKKAFKEKEQLQERLNRSKKMEALGLLAGGVAHDLNNILSGIVSYPDLILMDIPEHSPMRKSIETIKKSGLQAAAVVSDLLTLARGIACTKDILNLNSIILEYLESPEFKELVIRYPSVSIISSLHPELLNILCSSVHIKKVLMNLVGNAAEAIDENGQISISTFNKYVDMPIKGYDEVCIGEYAVLSVSDNGLGISPNDLERIFEPFYTRKVMGRSGTGLGLAVVWNTVQDHQGYIDVKTGRNGTIFNLYFPINREQAAQEKKIMDIREYKGKGEKILVVDDEENQRMIACSMLSRLGYDAQAVESGKAALEYIKENPVDLILLDMIMPDMNGCETYEQIIKIYPFQKALITSGFAETTDVKKAQKMGVGEYIKKPYTLEKIAAAIKAELNRPKLSDS